MRSCSGCPRRLRPSQIRSSNSSSERLGEQANGLKVRLTQAQRAAKVATANARWQQDALSVIQRRIGSMAAESYMQGGADPTGTSAVVDEGTPGLFVGALRAERW